MAELKLIIVKERATRTIRLSNDAGGVTPQASPMISEPKFGRRNSALDTVPSSFIVSGMASPKPIESLDLKHALFRWRNATVYFQANS